MSNSRTKTVEIHSLGLGSHPFLVDENTLKQEKCKHVLRFFQNDFNLLHCPTEYRKIMERGLNECIENKFYR